MLDIHLTYHETDVLLNVDDKNIIRKAEYSQPICIALQIALVDLLATWGIKPSAVVGHSSGEIAASYCAGALTSREAIVVAYYRGYVCKSLRKAGPAGGMAAIGMGKVEVSKYLVQGVRIACENSISSVTLSGDLDILENIMTTIKQQHPDVLVRLLRVEMAYHSRESCLNSRWTWAKKHRSYDRRWRTLLQIHSETPLSSFAKDPILLECPTESPS